MTLQTMDAEALAAINSAARGVVWLVDLDFAGGAIHYNSSSIPIDVDGTNYIGGGSLVSISALGESESNSAEKVTLGFSIVNQGMLAATLGNVEGYRNRRVTIWLQMMNERFVRAGAPVVRWSGYMDRVQVTRQRSRSGSDPAGGGSPKVRAERADVRAASRQIT